MGIVPVLVTVNDRLFEVPVTTEPNDVPAEAEMLATGYAGVPVSVTVFVPTAVSNESVPCAGEVLIGA